MGKGADTSEINIEVAKYTYHVVYARWDFNTMRGQLRCVGVSQSPI